MQEKHCKITLNKEIYEADEQGTIVIPFPKTTAYTLQMVVSADDFSSFYCLPQLASVRYKLCSGIFMDREHLKTSTLATVLLRPQLYIEQTLIPFSTASNFSCRIESFSGERSNSVLLQEYTLDASFLGDIQLSVLLPAVLRGIAVTLYATVNQNGVEQELSFTKTFSVNGIQDTAQIMDLFLYPTDEGYFIIVTGRNADHFSNIPVKIELEHSYFEASYDFLLETDEEGTIALNLLEGIKRINATIVGKGITKTWSLVAPMSQLAKRINAFSDEAIVIPVDGHYINQFGALVSIFGGETVEDYSSVMIKDAHTVTIPAHSLSAGEYHLRWFHEVGLVTEIHIIDRATASQIGDWIVTKQSRYETKSFLPQPLSMMLGDLSELFTVHLQNASEATRVHIVCSSFIPEESFLFYSQLSIHSSYQIGRIIHEDPATSAYASGREIGDEYKYIIDRKYRPHFPHLLLDKPTQLVFPHVKQISAFENGMAQDDRQYQAKGAAIQRKESKITGEVVCSSSCTDSSTVDFLSVPSTVLTNLKPDENGVVSVPYDRISILAISSKLSPRITFSALV